MTTHAPLRSQRTQAQAVCHVRGLGDGDAPTSPVKIQGYWQDENALWSFMGDDLNRLHEPWVKDIVVERIAASDQVFNEEVTRRSALSQPERWANRRWVIGRVGEVPTRACRSMAYGRCRREGEDGSVRYPQTPGSEGQEFFKAVSVVAREPDLSGLALLYQAQVRGLGMWCKRHSEWHPYIKFPHSGNYNLFGWKIKELSNRSESCLQSGPPYRPRLC